MALRGLNHLGYYWRVYVEDIPVPGEPKESPLPGTF
jgi:hypothetical protein